MKGEYDINRHLNIEGIQEIDDMKLEKKLDMDWCSTQEKQNPELI